MNKIKAILFDMDGVLIEAKDWHFDALNRALDLFGMAISRYDHLVTYDGLPTKKKLEMLSLERNLPTALHRFINKMKQNYTMELVLNKCKPVFYHEYALSRLGHDGFRMAVCSNSIRNSIELMMDRSNLGQYLEFMISAEDVNMGKPNPEIYNLAISRMMLKPEECLILEDNEHGIQAALASGAHLMRVNSVEDVNYPNIRRRIQEIESSL